VTNPVSLLFDSYYSVLKWKTKYFKDIVLQLSCIASLTFSNLERIISVQVFCQLWIIYMQDILPTQKLIK